jgi:hypothetical protein
MIGFWNDILSDVPPEAVPVEHWDGRAWFMLSVVGVALMAWLRWRK